MCLGSGLSSGRTLPIPHNIHSALRYNVVGSKLGGSGIWPELRMEKHEADAVTNDEDPCEQWVDDMMANYRASLTDPQVVGDDDTGYIVSAEGSTPAEMAEGFMSAIDDEKMAILLAYAIRRCALTQLDLENR